MSDRKKVVSLRLGSLEEEVNKKCEEEGITESQLLKKALIEYLKKSDKDFKRNRMIPFKIEPNKADIIKKRIEISLTESELDALERLSKISIYSTKQALIVGIIRAYFLNSQVFQLNEVIQLKKANAELNSIGRNLNQLAKLANMNEVFAEDVLNQRALESLSLVINSHSQYVRDVIQIATLRTKFKKD